MSEWPYIIASYVLTWVILGGFAIYLNARTSAARRALQRAAVEAEP